MSRPPRLPVVAGVLLVLLVLGLGALAWQVRTVRDGLVNARTAMEEAHGALEAGDIEVFRAAVRQAEGEVAAAARVSRSAPWGVASRVPLLGRSPRVVRGVVDVTESAVRVGAALAERAEALVDPAGDLRIEVEGGQVDVQALRAAEGILAGLPLERLRQARERLAGTGAGLVPPAVASGRQEALALGERLEGSLTDARTATAALSPLLGADGPRRYLVALQNSAELRGTGGLITLLGELSADDGTLTLTGPEVAEAVSAELHDGGLPAVEAPRAFVDRYGRVGATRLLQNVNLDPDLSAVGPVLLNLYEERGGDRLDGVIALDPVGLAEILGAIGPVDVPDDLAAAPRVPDPVPPAELPRVLMVEAYELYGGDTPARRRFQTRVVTAALELIVAGSWDAPAVLERMTWAVGERHVQVYAADPAVQEKLTVIGASGRLRPRPHPGWERADLLAVTANNAAANKQDVHVGHALTYDIDLTSGPDIPGEAVAAVRVAAVTVELLNPLPVSGRHRWIIGSAAPGGAAAGLTGPPGLNRTWWTAWAPFGTRLVSGADHAGEEIGVETGTIHQMLTVDEFMETPSEDRRSFSLRLSGPVVLERDGDDLLYRLTLWRQAKAIPDDLTLRLTPPDGWDIADAEIVGGDPGPRLTVSADAVSGSRVLRAGRDGDDVEVRGEVGEDLHVEVRLVREALWRRILPG